MAYDGELFLLFGALLLEIKIIACGMKAPENLKFCYVDTHFLLLLLCFHFQVFDE